MAATPESGIFFFKTNGHNHDGVNSSVIDTKYYSIFDFDLSSTAPDSNLAVTKRRGIHKVEFESYIVTLVKSQITNALSKRIKACETALGL